uniref:Cation/H+ exchanger transmembrane domain-containing protein n=1 Tax=Tetranychus urticae TaxID=32264 RepID=T1KTR3_TETUR
MLSLYKLHDGYKITISVRIAVEPTIVITLAYLAYVTGYLFNFSAILSLMACGLFQAKYAVQNISKRSDVTIKYLTKISSSLTETIIFMFLGFVLVQTQYHWHSSFIILTTFYCIIARFMTTFILTYTVNVYFQRIRIVNLEEQILMAYGGLRGAIAFSLSDDLDQSGSDSDEVIINHRLIKTTVLFIILFTVFVLGSTTKPLVKALRVQIQTKRGYKHFTEFNKRVARMVMQGIEVIAGQQSSLNWMKKIVSINEKYLERFLLRRNSGDNTIVPSSQSATQTLTPYDSHKLETPEKDPLTQWETFYILNWTLIR